MPLSRRSFLALLPGSALMAVRPADAAAPAARVTAVEGRARATLPDGSDLDLATGMDLPDGTRLQTTQGSRMGLALQDGTLVNAGPDSRIVLTALAAGQAGSLNISGIAVVDRRRTAPAPPLTVTSDGFEVTLQDARVFLARLTTRFPGGGQVFVKDGEATVAAPGARVMLVAGEGIDLPAPPPPQSSAEPMPAPAPPPLGAAPAPGAATVPEGKVYRWSDDQVEAAFASVGLLA